MKNPETRLKELVQKDLKKLPNLWFSKIQQVCIRGTPDLLACVNGKFVAIELKRSSKEKPDALQELSLNRIAEAGGIGLVVNPENWQETYRALIILSKTGHFPLFS